MKSIDLFANTAAILISIVSNSYYGVPRGQIHINLPPEHPIMSFETIEIKMAAVSAKRSMENLILKIWTTLNAKRNFASIKKTSRCWQKSLIYRKLSPAARDP